MKRLLTGCILLICATVAVIAGCSQWLFDSPLGFVNFLRGPESYRVDYVETVNAVGGFPRLLEECQMLAERSASDESCEMSPKNLPPVLATLKPQFVDIYGDEPFMIIQTSGGFYHRGLLVSLTKTNNATPTMRWLRGEVYPGVFEYRE